jgi:hypothetical protein|tara:strand:+ start:314 stop:517 length:204 start_codon:yes stop_codon:yes gene_type:complete
MTSENNRELLRAKLRDKVEESRIERSNKNIKNKILHQTLKEMGIDKDKLTKDMEDVKKEGLTINLTK